MLTQDQRAAFDRTGILKLEGVFDADAAARMRAALWDDLGQRYAMREDDPSTWLAASGFKKLKKHPAFAPVLGDAVCAAFDELLGKGDWVPPKHYGQVLVTMPQGGEWRVPHRLWHSDFSYDFEPDELFAVKYWAFFGDVGPGGGGTPQIAGSHILQARYVEHRSDREYKRVRDTFLQSHPWLVALSSPDDAATATRNARFMDADTDIDGVPARVVELTGSAGDVYITHPWVMHTIAPNAASQPRLMRTGGIYRTDAYARARALSDADDDGG